MHDVINKPCSVVHRLLSSVRRLIDRNTGDLIITMNYQTTSLHEKMSRTSRDQLKATLRIANTRISGLQIHRRVRSIVLKFFFNTLH